MLEQISQRMNQAVEENVFPGAVVLVAYQGKTVFHEAFGSSRIIPQKVPMTRGTLFDIASLTKPVATGTACMLLVQRGLLKIEDPVHKIVPEFEDGEKEKVKIFHLLTHSSGFRGGVAYCLTSPSGIAIFGYRRRSDINAAMTRSRS